MAFLHENFMFHSYNQEDYSPYPPQFSHGVGPTFTKRSMSFSGVNNNNKYDQDQDHDLSDDDEVSQSGGDKKKIRLNLEQVKALEKSFEMGNKLEPDRKMQLARTLNLQPRQVAIWFQNRRARWRIKQLEKDYDLLKNQFEDVKVHNEALQSQNKKLHAELLALKSGESTCNEVINPKNENDHQVSWSNGSEDSSNFESSKSPLINSSLTSSFSFSFKQLFPSSLKPTSITQLLHSSSRSDLACPKIDHQMVQDGSFCNMFNGADDQTGLWPWPEQHRYQ